METGIQTVDLHGCTVYQAKIAIDAHLKRARSVYRIRLIHGCHGGTALRDMIRKDYRKHPKVLRLEIANNTETDLVLREW
jgi:DNA-nicking Smr family endonuclease